MTAAADLALDRLIDFGHLASWMQGLGFGAAPVTDIVSLTGGTQNILVRFKKGAQDFVLRRPPASPRPESDETMRREARVLRALAGTNVPHPRLIAACDDESVLGVAFYLMQPVDGFNAINGLPALHAGDPAIRGAMGLSMVDGAAALARVDYRAVGLEDFGRPENYLHRQVSRWRAQLDGYVKFEAWPGVAGLPGVDAIAKYLEANVPPSFTPGIMHGDYSIGNVMFRNDGPELAAIIDWELATIGDPLVDLGWLLATWPGVPPVDLNVLLVKPWDGFPSANELVAHYTAQSDRDLSAIGWYFVLACYKLGIILEGTHARACAGKAKMETGLSFNETAVRLFRRALHRIDAG